MVEAQSVLVSAALVTLQHLPSGAALGDREAAAIVAALKRTKQLKASRVALSIDLINHDTGTWHVAAATDPSTPLGVAAELSEGLTGWIARTAPLRPIHAETREVLPESIRTLPSASKLQSAFCYPLQRGARFYGALWAVSDAPHGVTPELAGKLVTIGAHIDAHCAPPILAMPTTASVEPIVAKPVLGELIVPAWIARRLSHTQLRFANFWRWDAHSRMLTPLQVTAELQAIAEEWLGGLQLSEGFVGTAANSLREVVDTNVRDGVGADTGIRTPFPEIRPGLALRAIFASPVRGAHRFYGVLALVADEAGAFPSQQLDEVRLIGRELAAHLDAEDDRRLHEAQTEAFECLMRILGDDLTRSWNFSGYTAVEYPTVAGVQERPQVIAWATTRNTDGSDFGVLAAYDGHRANVGRVLVDATWHHWFNINLLGFLDATNPANPAYDPAVVPKWESIKAYFRNVGLWLARPSLQGCLRNGGWIWTCQFHDIRITFRPIETVRDRLDYYWQLGTFARDAMGRLAPQCQTTAWILRPLLERLPLRLDPWAVIPKPPLPNPPPWLPVPELETVAMGGAVHELLSRFHAVGEGKDLGRVAEEVDALVSRGAATATAAFLERYETAGRDAGEFLRRLKDRGKAD